MKSQWFWIVGGLLIGTGFLFLIGAFGDTGFGLIMDNVQQQASISYSTYGYDASLDVAITNNGITAIFLLFSGLILLVGANARAYKDTDGIY